MNDLLHNVELNLELRFTCRTTPIASNFSSLFVIILGFGTLRVGKLYIGDLKVIVFSLGRVGTDQ